MTAPDLSNYRAVHAALRQPPHRLAEAAADVSRGDRRRVRAMTRYWKGYAGEILAHHTVEDDFFFPALVERVPVAAELMDQLETDHRLLDELSEAAGAALAELDRTGGGSRAAGVLTELGRHMDDHLDLEDAEVLPLFERHFDAVEYGELDEQALKSLGIGAQAAFTVPFVASAVTDEERAHLLELAPGAFRLLYRMTRRRHGRLAAAAMGGLDAPAPAATGG